MLENCSTAKSVETFLVPVSVKEQTSAGVCDSCAYIYIYILLCLCLYCVYIYVPIFHILCLTFDMEIENDLLQ